MSDLSTGDLALMQGNGGFGNGNDAFMWIFALLILAGGGFGGLFGGNSANAATASDIQRAVDLNGIQQGQADISADIQRGIYEINGSTKDAAYNNLGEIRDVQAAVSTSGANIINTLTAMQANQQNCCCTTQRAIDGVNYNLATQSAAIQATDTANTQKILDAISANKIADLESQVSNLQLQNAMAGVVRYPMSYAYATGSNPFCGCSGGF